MRHCRRGKAGPAAATTIALALAVAISVPLAGSAQAQPVESFYRGRTITLVAGFTPGGSNDVAGRLVGRHLGRFLPGSPAIVVQNMPGAGGLIAANHLYNLAARDGSVIGQLDRSVPLSGLRGAPNVKFDPLRLGWLGSLSSYRDEAYAIWISARHPVRSLADLARAATAPKIGVVTSATNHLVARIAREVLAANISVVPGYPGGAALWLAFENGEVDGLPVGLTSVRVERPHLWQQRSVRALLVFGTGVRHPALPDAPTARELAGGDPARLALIELTELPFFMAQPFLAPPDVPADRLAALQTAFLAAVADPELVAEAGRLAVELSPVGGDAVRARLAVAAAAPREVLAAFNRIADGP